MDAVIGMIPSSPSTETSSSSSGIDTESTGSFFRDRSTTLGTLMGVSLADEEELPQATRAAVGGRSPAPAPEEEDRWRWRRRWSRRRRRGASWWRLCRDDGFGPTSLDQFLDMERRLPGDGGEAATAPLFENGSVLPSSRAVAEDSGKWKLRRSAQGTLSLARLPVLLIGICTGGA